MGSSLIYISIAYYMQKWGGWVQIACTISYVLNGRPLCCWRTVVKSMGVYPMGMHVRYLIKVLSTLRTSRDGGTTQNLIKVTQYAE